MRILPSQNVKGAAALRAMILVGCSLLVLSLESCKAMIPPPASGNPSVPSQTPGAPSDPTAAALVAKARTDLAQRLGIQEDQIQVSSAAAVTWPDSSLGCPKPGMAYAQALVPGYLIILEAAGNAWEYHADRKSLVFYCETPQPPVPGTPSDI